MMKLSKGFLNGHSTIIQYLREGIRIIDYDGISGALRTALVWTGAGVFLFGLFFGFDLIFESLEEGGAVVFEFVEENIESLYRKFFKLSFRYAQMATAYTFLAIAGFAGWLLVMKSSNWVRRALQGWAAEIHRVEEAGKSYGRRLFDWWNALDKLNKIFSLFVLVAFILPLTAIVIFVLGRLIVELI